MRGIMAAAFVLTCAAALQGQGILGSNLIVNGDAESGPAGTDLAHPVTSIPNWTKGGSGTVTVVPYTLTGYLTTASATPAAHGFNYFGGAGYPPAVTLSQVIDVSTAASAIAGGNVRYSLSGYLGSSNPSDYHGTAQLAAAFQNASGQTFTTATVGPVAYPGNGLTLQSAMGLVPAGTSKITVTLSFVGLNGGYGAADNLSLVLTQLSTAAGTVLGHNLVVNGGAEAGPNAIHTAVAEYIPGWSGANGPTVAPYGGAGWILLTDPGPADRGVSLFCGIPGLIDGVMYQDIDVSAAASLIDAGQVQYDISAWLGRVGGNPAASVSYSFYDWSDPAKQLGATAQLTAAGLPGGSALVEAGHTDVLPQGTRRVHIEVDFAGPGGGNASLADNIAFTLAAPSGPPVITPGGVVSAGAFGGFTAIAPGSWIEIYGANLASATQQWGGSDFVNGVAPASLGNVTVSVAGKAAFIDYISAGQVNALVPSDAPAGPGAITVTNTNGTSDPFGIYINATEPGFLAPATFTVAGKQYVAAILSDGSFALPANAITGVTSRPAKAGETITIYGVGFGPVSGGFTAGTIVTAQNTLTAPFQVQFGTTNATATYDGLAPSYTGLYQFNVTVPTVAANNAVPISFSLGGAKGTQTLYIAVGN